MKTTCSAKTPMMTQASIIDPARERERTRRKSTKTRPLHAKTNQSNMPGPFYLKRVPLCFPLWLFVYILIPVSTVEDRALVSSKNREEHQKRYEIKSLAECLVFVYRQTTCCHSKCQKNFQNSLTCFK